MAELIVLRPALRVFQYLIGLGCLPEFFFCRFITRVLIRMVLHRHLAIGGLNLLLGGIFLHAQNFVIIGFISHGVCDSRLTGT